ncbi:DUF1887 family CARF protein [Methylomonas sp. HYX-M1]|uniref:Card1-like endonuclease domain-containing protein n=1 Tax=Methylomonas sp. HYX-M1 TaxID=3139307 RepID=UPI00345BD527
MKPTAHLILVSAQPIPNLTPMLDEAIKPKKVLMLVSPDMCERANALEAIFKPRGINVEQYPIDDAWDASQISDAVLDILGATADGELALNATGGTKLMSIAAYEAFRSMNAPIYYVHPERDSLLWLSPKQASHELADRLKLKEYLMAYGACQVDIPEPHGVRPEIRTLTETLLTDIERYADDLGALNYLAYKADNPTLTVEVEHGPQSKPMLWELLELFERAGTCRISGHRLRFTDADARFMTNGGWLELHTYGICLNLKKTLNIQDIACNVTIQRQPAGKTPVKNEIDVGLIRANRLHLIECKTKQFEKNADVLYKLDSLRDLIGGLQAKAMLVSFNDPGKATRARARDLKIALCCKTDLRNLQHHLHDWLTADR